MLFQGGFQGHQVQKMMTDPLLADVQYRYQRIETTMQLAIQIYITDIDTEVVGSGEFP